MYYRIKTSILSQSMTDILDDDDDEYKQEETNFSNANDLTCSTSFNMTGDLSLSSSISELLDPRKKIPDITNYQEFEAVETNANNDNAWNSSLIKPPPKSKFEPQKPARNKVKTGDKKIGLNMTGTVVKAPRNPRKALVKTKSSQHLSDNDGSIASNDLPDLETILLEKSRRAKIVEVKKVEVPTETEIKTSVDNNWLNRNSADDSVSQQISSVTATSSFGISNLTLGSISSTIISEKSIENNSSIEVKYHSCDVSEDEKVTEVLPVSKKRKISDEKEDIVPAVTVQKTGYHYNTDDDDSDKDPNYDNKVDEKSPSPVMMKRKKSLIKRSKEGISKVTKKVTSKLLTRGRKRKENEGFDDNNQVEEEGEDQINYFIDTEFDNVKTVPRFSEKLLNQSEKLIENFVSQTDITTPSSSSRVFDHKTAAKKENLEKKIASGTLNDNYVRVNLKKKVFVRGKKAFNFSRYKKTLWKSKKQAASLNDMRGCDGGVLKCFNCGGVGHFAQNCKQKGDNLLPADVEIEEESTLPTLEEAAKMAQEQKLLVHATKPNAIPSSSNDVMWKNNEISENNEDHLNKENINEINLTTAEVEKKVLSFKINLN